MSAMTTTVIVLLSCVGDAMLCFICSCICQQQQHNLFIFKLTSLLRLLFLLILMPPVLIYSYSWDPTHVLVISCGGDIMAIVVLVLGTWSSAWCPQIFVGLLCCCPYRAAAAAAASAAAGAGIYRHINEHAHGYAHISSSMWMHICLCELSDSASVELRVTMHLHMHVCILGSKLCQTCRSSLGEVEQC